MEIEAMDYIDWDEGRDIPVEEDEPEAECEHIHVRVEEGYDVNDEYVTYFEQITCRDCGQDLVENFNGELEAR